MVLLTKNHQIHGGQEVRNNLMNCAVYLVYFTSPPDQRTIRSLFFVAKTKNGAFAPDFTTHKKRLRHLVARTPGDMQIITMLRMILQD